MKPFKSYLPRHTRPVRMRELEVGDHPHDHEGRELPFVPGDLLVQAPFQAYVLSQELAQILYIAVEE